MKPLTFAYAIHFAIAAGSLLIGILTADVAMYVLSVFWLALMANWKLDQLLQSSGKAASANPPERASPGRTGAASTSLFVAASLMNDLEAVVRQLSESFVLMQENLHLNAITNVQIFDEAIGASSGELILDLTGGEPLQFQSYLKKAANVKKSLSVSSLSLADALAKLGMESCDLLKLDCEGAEYSILFSTPQPILEHIRRIVMEYHDNLIQYNHSDLARFLNERGFQVETYPNPVHSHLGYLRAIRKN